MAFFRTLIRRLTNSESAKNTKPGAAKEASSHLTMQHVLKVKGNKGLPSAAQLRAFPEILSKKERLVASFAALGLVVFGFLAVWFGVNGGRTLVPAPGGELTEGLLGQPQTINPLYALANDIDVDLSRLVYNGLMRYDGTGNVIPDLAESYTISEDGLTYTFTIRDDVKWHDGEQFSVNDVIFMYQAIQAPGYRSPFAPNFDGVSFVQIDEKTIEITREEAFAPFISQLTIGILPAHLWGSVNPLQAHLAELNTKPIGTGPYRFERLTKDSGGTIRTYTMKRYANYHLGGPYLQRLNFKLYSDSASAADALRNNNVESISFIANEDRVAFRNQAGNTMYMPYQRQYTAAFFNLDRDSAISTKRVREALMSAIDTSSITDEILYGFGKPIDSFILLGTPGYLEEVRPSYPYDRSIAAEYLVAAGWDLQEGNAVRTNGDAALTLELVTLNAPELLAVSDELKRQWAEVGVDVSIRSVDFTTLQADILQNRNYDILLSGEQYGIDADPYAFWHSSQTEAPGLNLSAFRNRNADSEIIAGQEAISYEDRETAYRNLQELVLEDAPALFLYQPAYAYVAPKRIQGITMELITAPADRFSQIHEWYIKTRRSRE
ncbi:MAG: peptide ABC transporter substrate-binding protein [bacterium]|nr:peptide ABC transporter substrate-binding protein [bacterium]